MSGIPQIPRVIVAKGEGQLGNRLFQAATFLAASFELGFEVWNPAFGEYAKFFPSIADDVLCRPGRSGSWSRGRGVLTKVVEFASCKWGEGLVNTFGGVVLDISRSHDRGELEYDLCGDHFAGLLERYRFVVTKGWKFRAQEALLKHRERLREIFLPHRSIDAEVSQSVIEARSAVDLLVGVHVRLGDYASWQGGRYLFQIEDYARWMREVVALNPGMRVGFLVCSNGDVDGLFCMDGLRVSGGPGSAVADLYALAACDRLIGPPSTFTLWASFYGMVPLHMLEERGQLLWDGGFVLHKRV